VCDIFVGDVAANISSDHVDVCMLHCSGVNVNFSIVYKTITCALLGE